MALCLCVSIGHAEDSFFDSKKTDLTPPQSVQRQPTAWHYGLYLDLSYPVDFNFPENHRWRSKVTTQRVNELTPNMGLGYVRKDADESSRRGRSSQSRAGTTSQDRFPMPASGTEIPTRMPIRSAASPGPKGGEVSPGVIGLTQAQHLLIAALLWTYDSP